MKIKYNDGGREDAGYKGYAGDCVIRAIAITTKTPYQKVYDELFEMAKNWVGNNKSAREIREEPSPRNGCSVKVAQAYLSNRGWEKVTTQYKLDDDIFKKGSYICSVRKHYTAVIDGVLHDTYDCQMTTGKYAEKTVKTVFHYYRIKEEIS